MGYGEESYKKVERILNGKLLENSEQLSETIGNQFR